MCFFLLKYLTIQTVNYKNRPNLLLLDNNICTVYIQRQVLLADPNEKNTGSREIELLLRPCDKVL